MPVILAVIAAFPILTLLMICLAKTENVLFGVVMPRVVSAESPAPGARSGQESTVS